MQGTDTGDASSAQKPSVAVICNNWRLGRCRYGDSCRYLHQLNLTFPGGMGLPPAEAPPAQPMLLTIAAAPLRPELYKTQLCKWWMSSGTCQHGADCRFAHGYHQQQSTLGIGAAGRNPELYKTQLCKWWLACSSCQHGINCRFAHGEHELQQPPGSDVPKSPRLLKPELYKTQLCKWWMKDSICQHGSNCSFAHGEADLIQAESLGDLPRPSRPLKRELYKTQLCKWWLASSSCQHGINCRFAHGEHELRAQTYEPAALAAAAFAMPSPSGLLPDRSALHLFHGYPDPHHLAVPLGWAPQHPPLLDAAHASGSRRQPGARALELPRTSPAWGTVMLGKPTNYAVMIETAETASMLVDELHLLPANKKKMYLALQGVNLGRHGRACLGLLTIPSTPSGLAPVYLLDFVKLPNVLEIRGSCGNSLRDFLQDAQWQKFMFDPRCDSDCLFHTCGGILMSGVICLQLAEVGTTRLMGRARRIVQDFKQVLADYMPLSTQQEMQEINSWAEKLFMPAWGGRPSVFEDRPLAPELLEYCCARVSCFEHLESVLYTPLPSPYQVWVEQYSANRVGCCLVKDFSAKLGKEIAPSGP